MILIYIAIGVFLMMVVIHTIIIIKEDNQEKLKEKYENDKNILKLIDGANKHLHKLNSLTMTSAKVNNCRKALGLLYEAQKFRNYKDVIKNYDQTVSRIRKLIMVYPLVEYIDKSDATGPVSGRDKKIAYLMDAICYIKANKIKDADIIEADIYPKLREKSPLINDILEELSLLGLEIDIDSMDCYKFSAAYRKSFSTSSPSLDIIKTFDTSTTKINILYGNYQGDRSRRIVEVNELKDTANGYMFSGYCHLASETRTFRIDRVKEALNAENGEAIEDLTTYLLSRVIKDH